MPSVNTVASSVISEEQDICECDYLSSALTIFVAGATSDLAKQKTYPSLFSLFCAGYLPETVLICGYARSQRTYDDFRGAIRKFLRGDEGDIERFLARCVYHFGTYDDATHFRKMFEEIALIEAEVSETANRLFYLATPPSLHARLARTLKAATASATGWSRFVIEKPFGRDLASFDALNAEFSAAVPERD
eukprot:IDg10978t1